MSFPILYSATETVFDHNGFGILSDCASCEVVEEGNGIFEMTMTYPPDGIHFDEIGDRSIIKCKADQFRDPQLFRVYSMSKPMFGLVTIQAQHISYDLCGIPVSPFAAENISVALMGLRKNAVTDCPFTFWTDKTTDAKFVSLIPASIRSRLGGVEGSILDVYGGEYEFDNFMVKLYANRGMNRGVSIRYGKNLTDIRQEQNCASVATGIYPYWASENGALVDLPEKVLNAPGSYNFVKIRTVDLTGEFEEQPTVDQLRAKAESYIRANNIGVPSVSMTVSFAQLEQTEEYKHLRLLERISLFDTVSVEFPSLNVSASAKAVSITYDVLADRVKSVTLGSVRANIADTIAQQQIGIDNTVNKSDIRKAQESATAWLTNGKGYKVERRDELGRVVDTLYLDTPDIETAVHVMRIGQSGIGFSHSGVNGTYTDAWTIDGKLVANFITAGSLDASVIKTGALSSENGAITIDLSDDRFFVIQQGVYNGANVYSKFEIDDRFVGMYGWDMQIGDFIPSLEFKAGNNINDINPPEASISNPSGDLTISAGSGNDSEYGERFVKIGKGFESIELFGGERVDIDADEIVIRSFKANWESRGDGTYVLVGTSIHG